MSSVEVPDGFHVEQFEDAYFASIDHELWGVTDPNGEKALYVGVSREDALRMAMRNWESPFDWAAFKEGLEKSE